MSDTWNLKKTALALAVTASLGAFGAAHAVSEIDIANTASGDVDDDTVPGQGAVTVAFQLLATMAREADLTVSPPLINTRDIIYKPDIQLNQNATIEIRVVNGAVKATGGNALFFFDGAVDAMQMTDFDVDGAGNYTFMRFQALVDIPTQTPIFMSTTSGGLSQPTLVANQGLSAGTNVTMQVTLARDDNGNIQQAPLTAVENVMSAVDGTNTVGTVATSTIDVEAVPSRSKFVDETGGGNATGDLVDGTPANDTSLTQSTHRDLSTDTTVAEIGFVLDAADTYKLSLTRDECNGVGDATPLNDVKWGGVDSDTADVANCTWGKTGNFGDATGQALLKNAPGDNSSIDVEIIVDGTSVLNTGDWKVDYTIDSDDVAGADDQQELVDFTSHIWGINGMQAKTPYIVLNADGFVVFAKVVNESSNPARVEVDAIVHNQTMGTDLPEQTGVFVKEVPAKSNTTVSEADILTALGLDGTDDVYHAHLTWTVVSPQNSAHIAVFQKDAVGRTDTPVLYNTNNATDGRRWQ
jgi:hypothetical protein